MNITRSAAFWWAVFLVFGFLLINTESGLAQSRPGWGEIWQQRMTIGQAQLDSAFKLAESGKVNEALAMIDHVIATDPNNWRSYFLKSAVLVLAKRGGEALNRSIRALILPAKATFPQGCWQNSTRVRRAVVWTTVAMRRRKNRSNRQCASSRLIRAPSMIWRGCSPLRKTAASGMADARLRSR